MKTLARLEKVDLRDYWEDEAKDFTPWLSEENNIALLGSTIGMELEVIGREENVGSFRADILCRDLRTNAHVVIENQLEQTDHKHLGQVITYCAGLSAAAFIWIAPSFQEEHRAAVDWLNSITDEKFNFFAIEVELFRIGDSDAAPNFKIVAKPNGWSKNVRRQVDEEEMTATKSRQLDYWTAFKDFVAGKPKSPIHVQKPAPQHWTNFAIGRSDFHLSASLNSIQKTISVQFWIEGNNAKKYYDQIYNAAYEQSLKELSEEVEWLRLDDKKSSCVNLAISSDFMDQHDWPNQFQWIYDNVIKFKDFFGPYVKTVK
jgi:hypothetical protein